MKKHPTQGRGVGTILLVSMLHGMETRKSSGSGYFGSSGCLKHSLNQNNQSELYFKSDFSVAII